MLPYNDQRAQKSRNEYAQSLQNNYRQQHEVQSYRNDPHQHFFSEIENMHKQFQKNMMVPFDNDDFFGRSKNKDRDMDIFKGFDKIHQHFDRQMQNMHQAFDYFDSIGPGTTGKTISRSYVHHTKIGENGQKYEEKQFQNKVQMRDLEGNHISEKISGYHNSQNQQHRIEQERLLNSKGRNHVQEKYGRNGQISYQNNYIGIDPSQHDSFDQKWNDYGQKVGFFNQRSQNNYIQSSQNPPRKQQKQQKDNYLNYDEYSSPKIDVPIRDEKKRGEFVPDQNKYQDMPVRIHNRVRNDDIHNANAKNLNNNQIDDNNVRHKVNQPTNQKNGVYKNNIGSKNNMPKAG